MSSNVNTGMRAALALAAVAALALAAAPAGAQAPADARWVPWLGCWESVPAEGQPDSRAQICVHSTAGQPGVTFSTLVAGKVVSTRDVVADGSRHPVAEGGCRGWESDAWSRDARRVFRREELDCDGGVKRVSSGVIALLPDDRWVDIDAAGPARSRGIRVQRFRPMAAAAALRTGLLPQGEDLAIQTARTAASGPLLASDVVEALGRVDPEVVQALVYERGNGYDLDAKAVQRLADQRVPTDVIDLMVALSYPDFFTIDRGLARVALRDNGSGGSGRQPRYPGGYGGYPCYDRYYDRYYGAGYDYVVPGWIYSYPIGYGYRNYGYYDPCYGPYGGYGGGYWGGGYYPGGVIIGRGNGSTGGRVVKGGGYERPDGAGTRGTAKRKGGDSASGSGRGSSGSTGGSSGGTTARGSGGSTSTGRTAHPRDK